MEQNNQTVTNIPDCFSCGLLMTPCDDGFFYCVNGNCIILRLELVKSH